MHTIRALKIAILAYIHHKGWCSFLHKENKNAAYDCPLVGRIMFELNPPLIWQGSKRAFLESMKDGGLKPGTVVIAEE